MMKKEKTNEVNEVNEIQEEFKTRSLPRITYANKVDINPEPSFPSENLFEANDANEIKSVTNQIADSLETFDGRINEAVNKATQAEEQATRLSSMVSNNSTKIVALETKTNQQQSNITNISNIVNSHTNTLNAMLQVKRLTISLSEMGLNASYNISGARFQNYNFNLATRGVTYDKVIGLVFVASGGTSPELQISSPKLYTNSWIELPTILMGGRNSYEVRGHIRVAYI